MRFNREELAVIETALDQRLYNLKRLRLQGDVPEIERAEVLHRRIRRRLSFDDRGVWAETPTSFYVLVDANGQEREFHVSGSVPDDDAKLARLKETFSRAAQGLPVKPPSAKVTPYA